MHSAQPTAMESDGEVVMIPRNALMRQADLCIAILGAIQNMDPSENQHWLSITSNDLELLPEANLSAMSTPGIFDSFKRHSNIARDSKVIDRSLYLSLVQQHGQKKCI